ncbi:TolC family protein [Dyadobacter sp. 3J3]|uniref:TolC family protein n=1 Tax=Dyadobacter sp. 3J3 TaxID=2606600 RepID=UPI00135962CC|nr:TolC family protein [Dyadobacter sp. 3J3]
MAKSKIGIVDLEREAVVENSGYSGKKSKVEIWSLCGIVLLLVVSIFSSTVARGQGGYQLSLTEAIEFARNQNKWVQAAGIAEKAAGEDLKDVYKSALPVINVGGSYQRFSDLTLFTEGLSHASTGARRPTPNAATLGIDALYTIYSGGKQLALRSEQGSRLNAAKINTKEQTGIIALQTACQYFDLVRLNEQQKFVLEQLKRAQTRMSTINSLYENEKVTRSDVLRAEVNLSGVELSLEQNQNDIMIVSQKLDILLNVPDSVRILPLDSAGMARPDMRSLIPLIEVAGISSYVLQKAAENIEGQRARVRALQSGNKPNLNLFGAYGLNYPNYLFFPPVDQAYAIGFVGLKAQYSVSSLYHNKAKVASGRLKLKELEIQREAYRDNVQTEIGSYFIKYGEALSRIKVNERSVEQARVNYRIVYTKYVNQLSLLTDLLDADNLYQESRFNLVKAQTDAFTIYYHILYSSGKL